MKKTKSRAHRFAVIRNNAAVVCFNFHACVCACWAQAVNHKTLANRLLCRSKKPCLRLFQPLAKRIANNNRGRLVQEGMTIDYAIEPASPIRIPML